MDVGQVTVTQDLCLGIFPFESLEQVKQAITFVDRAYIYDNSVEDHLPQLLYRTTDGSLAKQYVADIPEWAQILL